MLDSHGRACSDFLSRILSRRSSIRISQSSYPIPRILKQKLFYDKDDSSERLAELRASHPGCTIKKSDLVKSPLKRTTLSVMVSGFARSKFDRDLNEQLRKDSSEESKQANRWILREVIKNEKAALQSREEIAQQNILTNLKNQKYG